MSKPDLPPLPELPEKEITDVICNDDGDEWPLREWLEEDLRAWATAYAEEAVRQALENAAAIADRQHFGGEHDDDLSWTDCAAVIAVKIRDLIPETSPGHKPAPVDTSSGHSALPPLTGCSPDEFAFSSELVTVDEAKSYAEEAVRQALDHAFNELNVLFMETLKARIPGEDLDHNDEQFNIGMCAQALGISRCQHVLKGLDRHPEPRDG